MEDDLELKMLRLKKLRELMKSRERQRKEKEMRLNFKDAYKLVKKHLVNRGEEVLDAALEQYPQAARRVVMFIASKIMRGEFSGKISGEMLMQLFEYLGMRVRLETKILYYRKGEYKSIRDLLR
ncbi:MAG: hypothetical protein B6U65_03910 [Candidatus Wolframiiraptor sp. EX4484-121]|nr:MAG: hypothetical protein B6U65_03910 [Candidatus Wolframiiraptor sp. EX4484-121]